MFNGCKDGVRQMAPEHSSTFTDIQLEMDSYGRHGGGVVLSKKHIPKPKLCERYNRLTFILSFTL